MQISRSNICPVVRRYTDGSSSAPALGRGEGETGAAPRPRARRSVPKHLQASHEGDSDCYAVIAATACTRRRRAVRPPHLVDPLLRRLRMPSRCWGRGKWRLDELPRSSRPSGLAVEPTAVIAIAGQVRS